MAIAEWRPPVSPGEPAPDFSLPAVTRDDERVSLSDYRGRSSVLVALFIGLWCPFCRRSIAQRQLGASPGSGSSHPRRRSSQLRGPCRAPAEPRTIQTADHVRVDEIRSTGRLCSARRLRAGLGFAGCSLPSYDRAPHALRTWLDSWSDIGRVSVRMARRGGSTMRS